MSTAGVSELPVVNIIMIAPGVSVRAVWTCRGSRPGNRRSEDAATKVWFEK
jgi:hypothetical protein